MHRHFNVFEKFCGTLTENLKEKIEKQLSETNFLSFLILQCTICFYSTTTDVLIVGKNEHVLRYHFDEKSVFIKLKRCLVGEHSYIISSHDFPFISWEMKYIAQTFPFNQNKVWFAFLKCDPGSFSACSFRMITWVMKTRNQNPYTHPHTLAIKIREWVTFS